MYMFWGTYHVKEYWNRLHAWRGTCAKCFHMTHSCMWRVSFIHATWHILTHFYTWRDSFRFVTWLIHKCDMSYFHVWPVSFLYVTWLIHKKHDIHVHNEPVCTPHRELVPYAFTWLIRTCDVSHSYTLQDIFWLISILDMTHSYMWRNAFIHSTGLIHTRDVTHSYMWRDSCTNVS